MRFDIENVVCIKKADIEVGPVAGGKGPGITLITGPNESGKTVLRNAMAAALTGTYAIYGKTKDTAKDLVMYGADFAAARAIFEESDGEVVEGIQVTWPNCHVKPKGNPETTDRISVGWDTPLALSGKEWIAWLSKVAGVDVDTVDDGLADAIKAALNPSIKAWGDEIVKTIRGLGWDGAAADYASKARAARSAWAKLTGRNWGANLMGSDNVVHWAHPEHDPKLDQEQAETELAALKEELAPALALSKQIPPEERGQLRRLANEHDALAKEHARHVGELQEIDLQIAAAKTVYKHPCKNCGFEQLLKLVGGKLVDEDEEAEVDVEALRERRQKVSAEADRIMTERSKANIARIKLEQADATAAKAVTNAAALRAKIERLEPKVVGARCTKEAKEIAERAISFQRVAEFLAPGGYRRERLVEAMGDAKDPGSIAGRLHDLTGTMFADQRVAWIDTEAETMPCLLGEDLDWQELTWGGDASSSMLRVRAALQMIHAERVGAPCVLCDMIDTLQGPVRQAFIKAIVRHVHVPVVLFCALAGDPPAADPLAKAGLGRTYVIHDDGVVRAVA
jgi:hypothetical protein